MSRRSAWPMVFGCVLLLAISGAFQAGPAPPPTRLAGARAEIHAAEYETLQAALDALPDAGGIVHLPPGTFEISEPLILQRGDVSLIGSGAATHIKNVNTDGQPALIVAHPDREKVKGPDKLWRVHLANFRITGNPQSGHGVWAIQVNEVYLDGVTASYHGGDGVRLDMCYEDPRVVGCLLTYNKQVGLNLIGCHDIVVSACQFEENQDALHCTDGFNLCMTGNCLDDHLGNGVIIENTYGSVLSGNMIEECQGTAVILDRDCYGITVSANVIAHNGGGVDLRDAHGCAISANTLTINKTNGVRVGPDSGRITVTGNNFSNSYIGEEKIRRAENDRAAAGLVLDGTTDVAVSGNVFAGVRPQAVEFGQPSQRVLFSENVLTDAEIDVRKRAPGLSDSIIGENLTDAEIERRRQARAQFEGARPTKD